MMDPMEQLGLMGDLTTIWEELISFQKRMRKRPGLSDGFHERLAEQIASVEKAMDDLESGNLDEVMKAFVGIQEYADATEPAKESA